MANNNKEKSPAEVAFKALLDARAKLHAAGVEFYLVVCRDGYTADDGNVTAANAASIVQRLEAMQAKYSEHLG